MPKWSGTAAVNDPKKYRFGYNGKEDDDEWGKQDYGFRISDPRIGRFLSVDPLMKSYAELTTYQFASNTPIQAIDLDGLEAYPYFTNNTHFISLRNVNFSFVQRQSDKSLTSSFPDDPTRTDYSLNTQMYDKTDDAKYATAFTPQPVNLYTPQGYNIQAGKTISGRSSNKTAYFSRDISGNWTSGMGDVPSNSDFGLGGGTPGQTHQNIR